MTTLSKQWSNGCLCLYVIALAVAGCATTSNSTTGSWQQSTAREVPYQTVLVVAVTPDQNARYAFEQTLADAITDGPSTGIMAYKLGRQMGLPGLSREAVVAMAENSGADAVIVTRVLDRQAQGGKSQEEAYVHIGPTSTVVQNEDASMTAVMTSNYAVEVVPGTMVIKADAVLESTLYEPATGDQPVYSARTDAHFDFGPGNRVEEAAYRFALAIAKQLRRDGVIH